MSKKINIILSIVDDRLYEDVILPKKRSKKLSNLIVSLLEAYNTDSYVQAVVKGVASGVQEDELNSLKEALSGIQNKLYLQENILDVASEGVEMAEDSFNSGYVSITQPSGGTSKEGNGLSQRAEEKLDEILSIVKELRDRKPKASNGVPRIANDPGNVIGLFDETPNKETGTEQVETPEVTSGKVQEAPPKAVPGVLQEVLSAPETEEPEDEMDDLLSEILMNEGAEF